MSEKFTHRDVWDLLMKIIKVQQIFTADLKVNQETYNIACGEAWNISEHKKCKWWLKNRVMLVNSEMVH